MNLFFILLGKILPLYVNIGIGYLASRYLKIEREAVAALLFYIIGPVVIFSATMSVQIRPTVFFLPVFFYLFCSLLAFVYLRLYRHSWDDPTGNILAFTAGTGNTGYFGIALALILFEPAIADIFIFTVLASFFYETTSGFYIAAKGRFTARESLKKVLRLPPLYAFGSALVLKLLGIHLPQSIAQYTGQFKIVFTILGMMVIGMGLDGLRKGGGVDLKFLRISLFSKHVLWPLMILGLIFMDKIFTQFLDEDVYRVMFVFSIVPLAGNTVTLAVLFDAKPEKAAFAVLLSNLFSICAIPLLLLIYDGFM